MRIALLQISSGANKMENFDLVRAAATDAAEQGASLLVFPEATSQAFGTGRLDDQAEDLTAGEFSTSVAELARELGVAIVVGMFSTADEVERDGKTINRVYNTALICGPDFLDEYHKIHTYDAFGYRESDTVKPGSQLCVFDYAGVKIGVAICYDIRFPEQFKELARAGAELIVVPTSWQDGSGKLEQWQLLTRARALDSTSWLLACDQARPSEKRSGPTGIGHSVVVDPTGCVIASAGYEVDMVIADIDLDGLAKIRESIPVL